MSEKRIGKIKKASFGKGGYQDAQIGVSFDLGSDKEAWGVGDFWGAWATERSTHCKWTDAERVTHLGEMVMRLNKTLEQAKVEKVEELRGKPVEVTFDGNTLKEWRVLTEAI